MAHKKVEIKILKPVSCKFRLSHKVGDVVKMYPKQADEIAKQGYGKIVKEKEEKKD